MRSSTIRSICVISMIALFISFIPSIAEGQEDEPLQKIFGVVTEFKDTRAAGEPVPGAEVYIEQEPITDPMTTKNQTKTNTKGYFEFMQKAGDYRITVKASGFKKFTKVVTVNVGKELQVNIHLNPGKDVYDVSIGPDEMTRTLKPGDSAILRMNVKNMGNTTDTYNVSIKGDKLTWMSMGSTRSASGGGPYSQSVSNLEDNGVADIEVNVTVPDDAEPGNYTFTVTTRSYWDQQVVDEIPINIIVKSVEQEPEDEEESSIPFLALPSILFVLFLGGALHRKRTH